MTKLINLLKLKKEFVSVSLALLIFFFSFSLGRKALASNFDLSLPSWVKVMDLRVGDWLKTKEGWEEIASIEHVEEPMVVYNLSVSDPNTFWANGILAHNKGEKRRAFCEDVFGVFPDPRAWLSWGCSYSSPNLFAVWGFARSDAACESDKITDLRSGDTGVITIQNFRLIELGSNGATLRISGIIRLDESPGASCNSYRDKKPPGAGEGEYDWGTCSINIVGANRLYERGDGAWTPSRGYHYVDQWWSKQPDTARIKINFETSNGTQTCEIHWCNCQVSVCPSSPSISLTSPSTEGADEIVVTWGDVANNDSYRVQRRPSGGSWSAIANPSANATLYTDWGAQACATWEYRVGAIKSGCPDAWSAIRSIAQGINPPSVVAATRNGYNVDLTWEDKSNIENQFRIQRRTKNDGSWGFWGDDFTVGANSQFWSDASEVCGGEDPAEEVQYRVRAERTELNCLSSYAESSQITCPDSISGADAWFQTQGGDIHAEGEIYSGIPLSCVGADNPLVCDPYFSQTGDGGSPGVVSYGGGDPYFGDGEVSSTGWLVNASFLDTKQGYQTFASLLDNVTFENVGADETEDDSINDISDPGSGNTFFYRFSTSQTYDVDQFASSPLEGKIVVLIDSDLTIGGGAGFGNIIVRDGLNGGFLAFIVNGDLTIGETVDELHGFYLAEGTMDFVASGEGDDTRFAGEGMFMARNIRFQRDLGEANNLLNPAETFNFRPDLWINSPSQLWLTSFTWQELAPINIP